MSLLTVGGSLTTGGLRISNLLQDLFGLADPSLAINAYGLEAYSTNHPVLDISKQMSAWDSASGNIDWMIANGHVDAGTSWITSPTLPTNFYKTLVVHQNDTFLNGKQYRMRWTGAGVMTAPGGATIDSTSANEIVFTLGNVTGTNVQVVATSGPISSLTIVDASHAARYDAGERIDPDYATLISDMRLVRFMDWNKTNHSPQTTWASRPVTTQNSFAEDGNGDTITNKPGVPIELEVMLCNKIKADMWFTFPHQCDDNYITQAATYVRDNLHPDLVCHYEMSNEVWNFATQQNYFGALGAALWPSAGESTVAYAMSALGYRTYEMAALVDAVYAGILSRRGIQLNVQGGFIARALEALDAPIWQDHADDVDSTSDPFSFPYTHITHMSFTSYFGGGLFADGREAEIAADYLTSPATSDATIDAYLRSTGATGSQVASLPDAITFYDQLNAIAIARSIKMSLYEGGPHMIYGTQDANFVSAVEHWTESALGATFCTDIYAAWAALSEADMPFMQFQDVGQRSTFGYWTIWDHMNDTPSGYMGQLLVENAATQNWWGDTTDHTHGAI